MRWEFLSHDLGPSTPMYGGNPGVEIKALSSIREGGTANSVRISMPNHIGTHIDAPRHFFERGRTLDDYPAEAWIHSKVAVLDIPKQPGELLCAADLLPHRAKLDVTAVLVRTGFERQRRESVYWENNPGVDPDVGPWLRERCPSVRLLGFDFISVSRWKNREMGRAAHRTLLDPNAPGEALLVIEDMALECARTAKITQMIVAPMRFTGIDGGPCTVFALLD